MLNIYVFKAKNSKTFLAIVVISVILTPYYSSIQTFSTSYKTINPLTILGDKTFEALKKSGLVKGSGTVNDPYILEFVEINIVGHGIDVKNTSLYFVIRNCYLHGRDKDVGINVKNVKNLRIEKCKITDINLGIQIENSNNIKILNNSILDASHGISASLSKKLDISFNKISSTKSRRSAVHLTRVTDSVVTGNIIEYNVGGIGIYESHNIVVKDNVVRYNTEGIRLQGSSGIRIYNNYFENKRNYFVNNCQDIRWFVEKRPGKNIIGGSFIAGNYWSDYKGRDLDNDGIGDTDLPHGPGDEMPLVKATFGGNEECGFDVQNGGFEDGMNGWEKRYEDIIMNNRTVVHPGFSHVITVVNNGFEGRKALRGFAKVNAPREKSKDPKLPLGEHRSYTWLISSWFNPNGSSSIVLYMRDIKVECNEKWGFGDYILVVFEDKHGNEYPDVRGDFEHKKIYELSLYAHHEGMKDRNAYISIEKGADGKDWYKYRVSIPEDLRRKCIRIKILWLAQNWNSWGSKYFNGISSTIDNIFLEKISKKGSNLRLYLTRSGTYLDEEVIIYGNLTPNIKAKIYVQYRLKQKDLFSKWKTLEIIETDDVGRFTLVFKPREIGVYQFRAYWKGNEEYSEAISKVVTLKVRGVGFDLILDSIDYSPKTDIIPGKSITLKVRFIKVGAEPASMLNVLRTKLEVKIYGVKANSKTLLKSWVIDLKYPFQNKTFVFNYVIPIGERISSLLVQSKIRPLEKIERNLDNNQKTVYIRIALKPDLVVESIQVFPDPIIAGQPFYLIATVKNIGNSLSGSFKIGTNLKIANQGMPFSWGLQQQPLNALDTRSIVIYAFNDTIVSNWVRRTAIQKNVYNITIECRIYDSTVQEVTEENNVLTTTFKIVLNQPDLTVFDVNYVLCPNETIRYGFTILKVTVVNKGTIGIRNYGSSTVGLDIIFKERGGEVINKKRFEIVFPFSYSTPEYIDTYILLGNVSDLSILLDRVPGKYRGIVRDIIENGNSIYVKELFSSDKKYSILFRIDPENSIVELDETNNYYVLRWDIDSLINEECIPDLEITPSSQPIYCSVVYTPESPASPTLTPKISFKINFIVANIGYSETNNVFVKIALSTGNVTIHKNLTIPRLGCDQRYYGTVDVLLKVEDVGLTVRVDAIVDPDNEIDEIREDNNRFTIYRNITWPDLAISITGVTGDIEPSSDISILYKIVNYGDAINPADFPNIIIYAENNLTSYTTLTLPTDTYNIDSQGRQYWTGIAKIHLPYFIEEEYRCVQVTLRVSHYNIPDRNLENNYATILLNVSNILPDLSIEDYSAYPEKINESEHIFFRIYNTGNSSFTGLANITIIFGNFTYTETVNLSLLSIEYPSWLRRETFSYDFPPSIWSQVLQNGIPENITIIVSSNVLEESYDNNIVVIPVNVSIDLPDLRVGAYPSLEFLNYYIDCPLDFDIYVWNIGTGNTSNVTLHITIYNETGIINETIINVGSLDIHATKIIHFEQFLSSQEYSVGSNYTIKIEVDPENNISELSEDNNVISYNFAILNDLKPQIDVSFEYPQGIGGTDYINLNIKGLVFIIPRLTVSLGRFGEAVFSLKVHAYDPDDEIDYIRISYIFNNNEYSRCYPYTGSNYWYIPSSHFAFRRQAGTYVINIIAVDTRGSEKSAYAVVRIINEPNIKINDISIINPGDLFNAYDVDLRSMKLKISVTNLGQNSVNVTFFVKETGTMISAILDGGETKEIVSDYICISSWDGLDGWMIKGNQSFNDCYSFFTVYGFVKNVSGGFVAPIKEMKIVYEICNELQPIYKILNVELLSDENNNTVLEGGEEHTLRIYFKDINDNTRENFEITKVDVGEFYSNNIVYWVFAKNIYGDVKNVAWVDVTFPHIESILGYSGPVTIWIRVQRKVYLPGGIYRISWTISRYPMEINVESIYRFSFEDVTLNWISSKYGLDVWTLGLSYRLRIIKFSYSNVENTTVRLETSYDSYIDRVRSWRTPFFISFINERDILGKKVSIKGSGTYNISLIVDFAGMWPNTFDIMIVNDSSNKLLARYTVNIPRVHVTSYVWRIYGFQFSNFGETGHCCAMCLTSYTAWHKGIELITCLRTKTVVNHIIEVQDDHSIGCWAFQNWQYHGPIDPQSNAKKTIVKMINRGEPVLVWLSKGFAGGWDHMIIISSYAEHRNYIFFWGYDPNENLDIKEPFIDRSFGVDGLKVYSLPILIYYKKKSWDGGSFNPDYKFKFHGEGLIFLNRCSDIYGYATYGYIISHFPEIFGGGG